MPENPKPPRASGMPFPSDLPSGLPSDLPPDLESVQGGSTLHPEPGESPVGAAEEAPPSRPRPSLWPQIEGFEILAKLGQGGMGAVFLARDEKLGRQVAIKVVSQIFRDPVGIRDRFDAEIQTLARLQHTNIAQLYSAGMQGDLPYFVMEYVDGSTLEQLAREPMKPMNVAQIAGKLCDALALCHENGILHRDLKPSNILMTRSGQPKIADFGLAKVIGSDTSTTKTGEILGTPSYMAPEQASGVVKSLTPACDIYSLGAILYRLLTGRPPFVAEEPVQTIMLVISADPLRPRKLVNSIPADLETICLKCLEKNPQRRYASVEALHEDLRRFLEGRPILARPTNALEKGLKWAKRNPAIAVSTVGLALALMAAVVGLSVHNQLLTNELARTRRLAEHGSELSSWLVQEHFNDLAAFSGTTEMRHRLTTRVKKFLDDSYADMPQDAKYTRRLGFSYARLAGITGGTEQSNLGQRAAAEAQYQKALDLYDLASRQASDQRRIDLLRTDVYLALIPLYREMGQTDQYEAYIDRARQTLDRYPDRDWETRFLNIQWLELKVEREAAANQHNEALATLESVERLLDTSPDDADPVEVENQKIWIVSNRASSLEALGKLPEAEAAYQRAVDLARASHQAQPANAVTARRYSTALVQLGDIQFSQMQADQAKTHYAQALEILTPLAEADPLNVDLVLNQAQKLSRMALVNRYLSELDEAESNLRDAIAIHDRLAEAGLAGLSEQRNHATDLLALADLRIAQNRIDSAMPLLDQHGALVEAIQQVEPNSSIEWNQLAENHFSRAVIGVMKWSNQITPSFPGRETELYRTTVHDFAESLRYFQQMETESGLDYHQTEFRDKVLAMRKVFEDAIDQMDRLAVPENPPRSDF